MDNVFLNTENNDISDEQTESVFAVGNESKNDLALNMIFNDSVIQKALNVLEYFHIMKERVTIQDVSDALGLSKATAHRIINELKVRGYISQNSDKSYFATLKMMMVGTQARDCADLVETLMPYLIYFAQKYQCSAGFSKFGKLNSNCHVYSVNFDPAMQLPIFLPGRIHPMHCTSSGKIKLAAMSDQQIERWLNSDYRLIPYTSKTIIDHSEILAEIQKTREQGYAVSNGEYHEFVGSIAFPMATNTGRITGAISLSVPVSRLNELNQPEIITDILRRNSELPLLRY